MLGCRNTARLTTLFVVLLVIAGCSANPVTGEKELVLFSTGYEIETGANHYQSLQQAQGGRYTADPALSGYVASVGRRMASVSDRVLPYEFVVLNNSTPNAWALPGGKIAINRGLLAELENEAELAAVLGHEIVHAAARHGAQVINRNLIFELAALGVALAGKDYKYTNYIIGAGGLAFNLINQGYSREAERAADYHGMKYMHATGYDTGAAVSLQEKFVALAKGREGGWLTGLFASHPPSAERVANNRAALEPFPTGGDLGRERYRERLAYLRARQPAYEKADRAREQLDTSPEAALRDIEDAIEQEPREPSFHGIRGQILARQGRYRQAVRAYDAAIERDSAYYEHFLGRGLAYDALHQRSPAQSDLERSNRLLPTALATYALGSIVLADGNRAYAKRLFETVSRAGGDIAAAARRDYVMLDIVDAPWRYVVAEPFIEDGRVIVEVKNSTDHALQDVAVRVEAKINGQPVYRTLPPARLAANAVVVLETGLRYREEDAVEVGVRVLRAKPAHSRPRRSWAYRPYP